MTEDRFEFLWHSEIITHIAATVVTIVNNATNATRISTIHASDFVFPKDALNGARVVSNLTVTTDIGGVDYTL